MRSILRTIPTASPDLLKFSRRQQPPQSRRDPLCPGLIQRYIADLSNGGGDYRLLDPAELLECFGCDTHLGDARLMRTTFHPHRVEASLLCSGRCKHHALGPHSSGKAQFHRTVVKRPHDDAYTILIGQRQHRLRCRGPEGRPSAQIALPTMHLGPPMPISPQPSLERSDSFIPPPLAPASTSALCHPSTPPARSSYDPARRWPRCWRSRRHNPASTPIVRLFRQSRLHL